MAGTYNGQPIPPGGTGIPGGIAAPTPLDPTFQSVSNSIGDQQRQALAAMAQYGSAGKAAYDAAQAQMQSGQQNAVNSAISQATSFGAPQAANGLTAALNNTYGGREAGLASNEAAFGANQAGQQGLANNYFQESQASLPFLQNQTNIQGAQLQQAAVQKALQDSLAIQNAKLSNERLQMEIANAAKGPQLTPYEQYQIARQQAQDNTPAGRLAALGGAGIVGNSLFGESGQLASDAKANAPFTSANAAEYAQTNGAPPTSQGGIADYLGNGLGLPGLGSQLAQESPAGLSAQKAATTAAGQADYASALQWYQQALTTKDKNGHLTNPDAALATVGIKWGPAVAAQLKALFGTGPSAGVAFNATGN